jgi:hypothetical protein
MHRRASFNPYERHQGLGPGALEAHEDYQDPIPCGLTGARPVLEALMRLSIEQGIVHAALNLDELFPGNLDGTDPVMEEAKR